MIISASAQQTNDQSQTRQGWIYPMFDVSIAIYTVFML